MINVDKIIDYDAFECAIFDLDGTLINSTSVWGKVDEEFFARRKITMPAEFPHEIKTHTLYSGAQYLINELNLPDTPEDIVEEWQTAAKRAYDTEVTLKPYASQYLQMLKKRGYRIGLATSNDSKIFAQCLKNNGIYDYFDSFTQTDEVERRKGFPDVYELAASRMNAAKQKCIVFEDVYAAVKGAKSGGFFTVAVEDAASAADREKIKKLADAYIVSFDEIMT